jgi:nucleoside-diphosphate-sugar epimerase
MKILVTGATGKVGSRLAKRLSQRGDQVRAFVRDPARAAELRDARIELVQGDLLDQSTLGAAVRGVDAVVHCAAFFRGATPEQAHAVNDRGTQLLGSAARAADVKRFVFTSTGLVYGPNGGRLASEDDECVPAAAYPISKLAAERFLLGLEGLDVRVLRLPFVYGDGDAHIAEALPMMRTFSPTQRLSLGHHVDVAQAVAPAGRADAEVSYLQRGRRRSAGPRDVVRLRRVRAPRRLQPRRGPRVRYVAGRPPPPRRSRLQARFSPPGGRGCGSRSVIRRQY